MVNYQNGKIYMIEATTDSSIKPYIGSTTKKSLALRMAQHRSHYKQWKAGKCGKCMSYMLFDAVGIANCRIVLLENYPCNSRDELTAKEADWIRKINSNNIVIPGRTKPEYDKEYAVKNKERISEYQTRYREDNRQKLKEYKAKFYAEYKHEIQNKMKEKITCECGAVVRRGGKAEHSRTEKHKLWLASSG